MCPYLKLSDRHRHWGSRHETKHFCRSDYMIQNLWRNNTFWLLLFFCKKPIMVRFHHLRSYRDEIKAWNREEIPLSLQTIPRVFQWQKHHTHHSSPPHHYIVTKPTHICGSSSGDVNMELTFWIQAAKSVGHGGSPPQQLILLELINHTYRIFACIRHNFLHELFTLNTGVRLIHNARNLGCFTSSGQATQRSQIDDQPLPQPVSELRLGYDFVSIVFPTCLACL